VRENVRGYLLVIGASAAWSTAGLFVRWTVASSGLSALSLAFLRDAATCLCLTIGLAVLRPQWLRVERRDLPWLIGLGAVGIGTFHVLFNLAILTLGYAVATVLLYFSPAFVTLMAWLIWREPLTRYKVLAITMVLAGCVLVAGREELAAVDLTAGGLILGLAAAMTFAAVSLFGRPLAGRYPPWTVLTYGFGFAALTLLPFQVAAPAPPWPVPAVTWVWFGGLVLVATICSFGAYFAALRLLPASVASILGTSEVAFGTLISFAVFQEPLQGWQFVGAGLVVGGVILIAAMGESR
jgi:drug/metabolite transporter (DMT)-like permease